MFVPDENEPMERKKWAVQGKKNNSRRQVLEYAGGKRIQCTCDVGTHHMYLWAPGSQHLLLLCPSSPARPGVFLRPVTAFSVI